MQQLDNRQFMLPSASRAPVWKGDKCLDLLAQCRPRHNSQRRLQAATAGTHLAGAVKTVPQRQACPLGGCLQRASRICETSQREA